MLLSFGAKINQNDWTCYNASYNSDDSSISLNSGSIVKLNNSDTYSTKGTLSFSISFPTSFYGESNNFNSAFNARLTSAGKNYFSIYHDNYGTSTREQIFETINGNVLSQSSDKYGVVSSVPVNYTYTVSYVDSNTYSLKISEQDSDIVDETFEWDNAPEAYNGFYFNLTLGAPESIKLTNFSYTPQIPEPSTYAIIFSIFALGFVAYRKNK